MKKILVLLTIVVISGGTLWITVIKPPSGPSQSLGFNIEAIYSSNSFSGKCVVIVSNISDCPVEISGGFGIPWFKIDYLTNGVWGNSQIHTPGGGAGLLWPRETIKSEIQIPKEATALKIGLYDTSLTWRGKIAWYFAGSYFRNILRPVAQFLLLQDTRKRTKLEWYEEHLLTQIKNGTVGDK